MRPCSTKYKCKYGSSVTTLSTYSPYSVGLDLPAPGKHFDPHVHHDNDLSKSSLRKWYTIYTGDSAAAPLPVPFPALINEPSVQGPDRIRSCDPEPLPASYAGQMYQGRMNGPVVRAAAWGRGRGSSNDGMIEVHWRA